MKRIIIFIIAFVTISQIAFAYDFSVTSNGQTLYFYLYNGAATVTYPYHGPQGNGWYGYEQPSGVLVIPDSVAYNGTTYVVDAIGYYAFRNCIGITSVTIPATIDTIFNQAFYGCSGLEEVNMLSAVPPVLTYSDSYPFSFNANGRIFNIPCNSTDLYVNSECWTHYSAYLQEPEGPEIGVWITSNDSIIGSSPIRPYYDINIRCDSSATILVNVPNYGFRFSHWEDGSRDNPRSIILSHDTTLSATFERDSTWVDVISNGSMLGAVSGGGWYAIYDTATFMAMPSEHHHFTYWAVTMEHSFMSYDAPVSQNPLELYIEGPTTLMAHFAIDTHTVSVASSNITRGRVEGGGTFEYGAPCTVSAEAYSGYHFSHWSNGSTYNPYTFAVLEDTELTAIFLAEGEVSIDGIKADDIRIYNEGGHIVVKGTTDEVQIFDITGRNVLNEELTAGVYIVKIGNHFARKVVVVR